MLELVPEGLDIAKRTYAFYKNEVRPQVQGRSHALRQLPHAVPEPGDAPRRAWSTTTVSFASRTRTGTLSRTWCPPNDYQRVIGEAVEPFSYMKFPYFKPLGYPNGIYRVGPLARLNNCDTCGTPFADVALAEFRTLQESKPVASSFHYHYARLVEIIFALESMERLLKDPQILEHPRAGPGTQQLRTKESASPKLRAAR